MNSVSHLESGIDSTEESLNPKHQIAIIGASGRMGSSIQRLLNSNYDITAVKHLKDIPNPELLCDILPDFDITDRDNVKSTVDKLAGNGVRTIINCSGVVSVDNSEETRGDKSSPMYRVHVIGAENIAIASKSSGLNLIHLGSEYEFNGHRRVGQVYGEYEQPYTLESNPTWYGQTKAIGGLSVLDLYPKGSVLVRLSQVQSLAGGLFLATLKALKNENSQGFTRAINQYVSPITDITTSTALSLIEKALNSGNAAPIYHISSTNAFTSYDVCLKLADEFGLGDLARKMIKGVTLEQLVETGEQKVVRPKNSILSTAQFTSHFGDVLHTVEDEINLFKAAYGASID